MIIVQMKRMEDGNIRGFLVKGHANYAKRGEDIVCAGVSAITVGTVNSIEALAGVVLDTKMRNGFLSADIPNLSDEAARSKVQLLMESMELMLKGIAESYGEYIQIQNQ